MLMAEYVLRGLLLGATYGLLALPMNLMFVTVGTIDFALGAYALLAAAIGSTIGGAWGIAAGIGGALAASGVMAIVFVLLKRSGHQDTITTALASFGLAIAIGSIVLGLWGSAAFVRQGFQGVWLFAGIRLSPQGVLNLAIGLALLAALCFALFRTEIGSMLRASAMNASGAELAGIPVLRVQSVVFLVGGLIGGVTGILILYSSGLDFTAGLGLTLAGFAAAIIFGVRNPVYGFVGGLVIGIVEALSAGYADGAVTALVPQVIVLVALSVGLLGVSRFSGDRP